MSCSSSSGSGCSGVSAPAGASSAAYQRTDNENTYQYTPAEIAACFALMCAPFLLMLLIGLLDGLLLHINDLDSYFSIFITEPEPLSPFDSQSH